MDAIVLADSCSPDFISENLQKQFCNRSFQDRRATTQIRSSCHHLRIERGRYNKTPLDERTCNYWELNSNQLFIENDNHMLHSCSIPAPLLGKDPRDKFQNLSEILLNIVSNLYLFYIQQSISSEWVIVQVLRYIHLYTIKLRDIERDAT